MTSAPQSGTYAWATTLTRGELLDLVLDIEERFQWLDAHGVREVREDWEKLIPGSVRKRIEHATPSPRATADILDRANLGQLISVAVACWEHFADLLGDKPRFQVKTNELREWRNMLAHAGNPSDDQKVEIVVLTSQVGKQIPVVRTRSTPELGTVAGATVLWADDHPASGSRLERGDSRLSGDRCRACAE